MKVNATIFKSENAKRKLKNMIYNIQFRKVTGNVPKRQQPEQRAGNNPWPPILLISVKKKSYPDNKKHDKYGTKKPVKLEKECTKSLMPFLLQISSTLCFIINSVSPLTLPIQ